MEVAYRYLPVGASVVGGDWHDIVALPGGRAALIVGDVMGHGPEAAAVMVQLRTAARTLADLDLPPGEVLRRLDRMAAGMPAAPFATCIAAVIDTSGSSCVIAAAGHPPPVLALADGATRVPGLPPGLPLGLGAGAGSFEATQISLPPGATLALYTDGLAENRTRPLDDGITALRDALSSDRHRPRHPQVAGEQHGRRRRPGQQVTRPLPAATKRRAARRPAGPGTKPSPWRSHRTGGRSGHAQRPGRPGPPAAPGPSPGPARPAINKADEGSARTITARCLQLMCAWSLSSLEAT